MNTTKIVLVILLLALVFGAMYLVTTTVSATTAKSGMTTPQCGEYCGDPTMADLSDCRGCPTPMS